jgi:hypothetical protein
MEGSSERPSKIPIPLRLPVHPKPQSADERLDQMDSALSSIAEGLKEIQKRLTEGHPREEVSQMSIERPRVEPQPLSNPKFDILLRNPKFSEVLSVARYRLLNQSLTMSADEVGRLTQLANQLRPRMEGSHFSGDPPLTVLRCLSQFARVCDQANVSEAAALWIMEDFLQSPVKEAFRAQGCGTYQEAVHWLLISYAHESVLDEAVRRLQVSTQGSQETVRQFGLRLQMEIGQLGTLFDITELKALFAAGIMEPVRSLFRANQFPHELQDSVPFSVLLQRAVQLETGTQAMFPPQQSRKSSSSSYRVHDSSSALRIEVSDIAEELDVDSGCLIASSRSEFTCFFCYLPGHVWDECPSLRHLSAKEKSDIAQRRKSHYASKLNYRAPYKTNMTHRDSIDTGPKLLTRPGWLKDGQLVAPQKIWPDTVKKCSAEKDSSKNEEATSQSFSH